MHRAKERLEQAAETVKFLKESPLCYPSGCRLFSSCVTLSELDETWQRANEADYTWHIIFAKGSTKREVMSQMHHAFTTFQKEVEAQAQEASYKNLSIRATRGAYDSVMRSSIEEFIKAEDIDINGDRPMSGVSNQMIDQLSAELYKKAHDRVVKEIVDKRKRIEKHLKDEAKTKEELSKRQPEQLLEQYVSSCLKKIVTTTSLTGEEVKAEDVVSALKNVPKSNRKNFQKGDPKNVTFPGESPGKGKGVQPTIKGKRKGKGKPKNKSKGKGQGTSANKSQTTGSGKGKKKSSKGQGSGKGKKGGKNWRQDRRKFERSKTFEDPVIQLFSNLMEGATIQDWLSLFDFQNTRRHIYCYNHETRCVDQPCRYSAPWPVLWILARFFFATCGVASLYQTWSI